MTGLNFKRLTVENWREPDPLMAHFFAVEQTGGSASRMAGDDWARLILAPSLSIVAPDELRRLYEAARGAMLYGWCFYPLYALGIAQLLRSVETAVVLRGRAIGASEGLNFKRAIDHLVANQAISSALGTQLHDIRRLRNEMTHAKDQDILPPGTAVGLVQTITAHLNALFPDAGELPD